MRGPIQLCNRLVKRGTMLAVLVAAAGCAAERQEATGQVARVSNHWQVVHYDKGLWDPNKLADAADLERTARFFGGPITGWEKFYIPYYQELLSRVHEPSLFQQRTNDVTQEYRLLYLPAWSPPLILRFYRDHGQTKLRFYAWAGHNAPGQEEPFMTTICCSDRQWTIFLKQVQAHRFWELSSPLEMPQVKDGCRLVLEGLDHGRYHMVWNFESQDEPLGAIGMTLMDWVPVEKGPYFLQLQEALARALTQQRQRSSARQENP